MKVAVEITPSCLAFIASGLCCSFLQVVVLTQRYGQAYYHFLVENLSRITVVLDILLENPDIKVNPIVEGLVRGRFPFAPSRPMPCHAMPMRFPAEPVDTVQPWSSKSFQPIFPIVSLNFSLFTSSFFLERACLG